MNAIRKATEHKRKPVRPRVSEAGRRVLEWLDKYGWQIGDPYATQFRWFFNDDSMMVRQVTLVSLQRAGLVVSAGVKGRAILITDLGRSVLRGAK